MDKPRTIDWVGLASAVITLIILWYILVDDDPTQRKLARRHFLFGAYQNIARKFGELAIENELEYNRLLETIRTV